MATYIKRNMAVVFAILIMGIAAFAIVSAQPVYAADDDIDGGVYDGVPWRITSDYELIIGEEGKEYTFDESGIRAPISYPWNPYRKNIITATIEGIVHGDLFMGGMFEGCSSMTNLDLSGFDTSIVTDMDYMFAGCSSLTELDVTGFNWDNATYAGGLFKDCSSLTELDVSGIQTGTMWEMGSMFAGCSSLTELDVTGFDTSEATEIGSMFEDCSSLTKLDVTGFDTSQVTGMMAMFKGCSSLTELDVTGFDTSQVTNMSWMFSGCSSLTELDVRGFDTSQVTSMSWMFSGCSSLKIIDVSRFDTSNVAGEWVGMDYMFAGCSSLTALDLSSFDASTVSDMGGMFDGCVSLTVLTIGTGFNNAVTEETKIAIFPVTMYDSSDGTEYDIGAYIPTLDSPRTYVSNSNDDYSNVHSDFYCGKERHFTGDYGFYYKDSYFNEAATNYNHSLATMSLCMALSTYPNRPYSTYDKNIHQLMEKCGFTGEDNENYEQYNFNEGPTKKSIGCAIGSKQLKSGATLIAVAVRSSGYEAEWASNFTVGASGDHEGFKDSANLVWKDIKKYITDHDVSGDIKIWITGFSRGGAVATQTAAKLNSSSFENTNFSKDDIYAYGFATPAGAIRGSNPHSKTYSNIFSLVHYHDLVPLVAPGVWGFDRYGTTHVFPYSALQRKYAKDEAAMRTYFRGLTGQKYQLDSYESLLGEKWTCGSIGLFNRELVDYVARSIGITDLGIGARSIYNNKLQEVVTDAVGSLLDKNPDNNDILLDVIEELKHNPAAYSVLGTALYNSGYTGNKIIVASKNKELLTAAHANPEYYLAWMQVMDSNYGSSLTPTFSKGLGRYYKVNCPVDVKVYDSNNTLVAAITDEAPVDVGYDENEGDTRINTFIDMNDEKVFVLPIDEEYRVEITPRETCDISCSIEEFSGVSSETNRIINFDAEEVTSNEVITSEAGIYSDEDLTEELDEGSSVDYNLERNGEEIESTSEYRGAEEIENHSYNVLAKYDETMGTVAGEGTYTEGSFVKLQATSNEGYQFEGFYIDGTPVEDDDLDNDKSTVRIKVTGDVEVTAKFKAVSTNPCAKGHSWTHIVNNAGFLSNGNEYDQCTVCGIQQNQAVIPGYASYYVKGMKVAKGKGSLTVKWKKQSKKNLKKFNGYQVRYATKSDMSDAKYKTAGKKATSKKIGKLKKKTKYFVQVRTYTKKNGTTFYSKWSGKKSVKTK